MARLKLVDPFSVVRTLSGGSGGTDTPSVSSDSGMSKTYYYYSLKALEENGVGAISQLPVSIRIILEALVRLCDGVRVTQEDVKKLAQFGSHTEDGDVPFMVSRVILQDFTGVPLLVDLAAMRDAVADRGFLLSPLSPMFRFILSSITPFRSITLARKRPFSKIWISNLNAIRSAISFLSGDKRRLRLFQLSHPAWELSIKSIWNTSLLL